MMNTSKKENNIMYEKKEYEEWLSPFHLLTYTKTGLHGGAAVGKKNVWHVLNTQPFNWEPSQSFETEAEARRAHRYDQLFYFVGWDE
jgi:hypothetical protein